MKRSTVRKLLRAGKKTLDIRISSIKKARNKADRNRKFFLDAEEKKTREALLLLSREQARKLLLSPTILPIPSPMVSLAWRRGSSNRS